MAGEVAMETHTLHNSYLLAIVSITFGYFFVRYQVSLPLYRHALQFCVIPVYSVAKAVSAGRSPQADHASFYTSQVVLFCFHD